MVNDAEIKDWYNEKHLRDGKNAWRPPEAYEIFLDYLDVQKGKTLLDVGCGTGYLLKAAAERGLETYGTDISIEGVKIAQENSPHSNISQGKGEELNFPGGFFNYVTCLGALEHFLDMEKGINEMARVARDDALFCVVVPNANYFYSIITGKKGTAQHAINETLLSLDDWRDKFSQQFEILTVYQDTWHFRKRNIFSSLNPFEIIVKTICKFMYFLLPLNYTYQFIFIMKKRRQIS